MSSVTMCNASSSIATSCILIWLDGGPSHLETWDPKTEVPQDVRGPFKAIDTNVPGIRVSEHLTRCAKIADKLAIVRSLTSPLGEHGIANHYMLTGYQPSTQIQYPSMGSVVGQHFGRTKPLPNYVAIPESKSSMGAGFLGQEAEPFSILGDPADPEFRVQHLDYYPGITQDRIQNRRQMLDAIERKFAKDSSKNSTDFDQAFRLIDSVESKRVFDLRLEPTEVRDEYGPRSFEQCCLMARRLIEHGVRFVTVVQSGWDTHDQLTLTLRDGYSGAKTGVGLIPTLDTGLSALINDLHNRGLLDSTLVVVMGEFGRTPKLNTRGGRDHWPRVFSAVLAGGGTRVEPSSARAIELAKAPKIDRSRQLTWFARSIANWGSIRSRRFGRTTNVQSRSTNMVKKSKNCCELHFYSLDDRRFSPNRLHKSRIDPHVPVDRFFFPPRCWGFAGHSDPVERSRRKTVGA